MSLPSAVGEFFTSLGVDSSVVLGMGVSLFVVIVGALLLFGIVKAIIWKVEGDWDSMSAHDRYEASERAKGQ